MDASRRAREHARREMQERTERIINANREFAENYVSPEEARRRREMQRWADSGHLVYLDDFTYVLSSGA